MEPKQLKQAIAEDIRTLKSLNPDIIPARVYYGGLLKGVFSGLWKMSLILFITLCWVMGVNDDKNPLTLSDLIISSRRFAKADYVGDLSFIQPFEF